MGRLVLALISLGVISFIAYSQITAGVRGRNGKQSPQQTLQNVREKAKNIEDDSQKRADEALRKSLPGEQQ